MVTHIFRQSQKALYTYKIILHDRISFVKKGCSVNAFSTFCPMIPCRQSYNLVNLFFLLFALAINAAVDALCRLYTLEQVLQFLLR